MSPGTQRYAFQHPRWPANAGLGTIAYGANGDQKRVPDINKMWVDHDEKFDPRLDYRVWRRFTRWQFPSEKSTGWGTLFSIAKTGIEAEDSKQVWGILAVLSGCLARRANLTKWSAAPNPQRDLTEEESLNLAKLAEERLAALSIPSRFGAECAVVGCLLLDSAQNLRHKVTHKPMTIQEAKDYLERCTKLLQVADADWQPGGRPISFDAVQENRKATCDAIAPLKDFQLFVRMREVVFDIRGIIRAAIIAADRYDAGLLKSAYRFALSAWRYARAMNRGQAKWLQQAHRLGESETIVRAQLKVTELEELRALFRASQAARDLGDILASGRLSYLLVRHIPDWVPTVDKLEEVVEGWVSTSEMDEVESGESEEAEDERSLEKRFRSLVREIRNYPDWVDGTIRQIGLECDPRFPKPAENVHEKPVQRGMGFQPMNHRQDADATKPGAQDARLTFHTPSEKETSGPSQGDRALSLLVEEDQRTDGRWASILKHYEHSPNKPLNSIGELGNDLRREIDKLATPEEKRDAMGVCFKYGNVATGARILSLLPNPSLDELADLAHSIKRASQIIPLGIDAEQYEKWRGWLVAKLACQDWGRSSWRVLSDRGTEDMLVLHEILIGRSLAILRQAGNEEQRVLLRKHYEFMAESDLRGVLEAGVIAGAHGPATVNLEHAQKWLQEVGDKNTDGLGTPVCVWLAPVDENNIGVFLLASNGIGHYCRWPCGDSIEKSVSKVKMWLGSFAAGSGILPWDSFMNLGELVVTQANVILPGVRWLMLAASTAIGDLPWELLFKEVASQFVVSLMPNLSWAVLAAERMNMPAEEHKAYLSLSKAQKLSGLRKRLEEDACTLSDRLGSVGVALGHGIPVPEAFPICFARKPMWVDEWLAVVNKLA